MQVRFFLDAIDDDDLEHYKPLVPQLLEQFLQLIQEVS